MANRIRALRKQKGITMKQLGAVVGLAESTISQYETGKREPDNETLLRFGEYFGVTVGYILGVDESQIPTIPTAPNISPMPEMKQWKVLGGTACGEPIYKALEEESVWAPADIDADFVLRCVGDSMINARIFDGDVVFVKSCPVEDGQIGVVRIGDEYTLKSNGSGSVYGVEEHIAPIKKLFCSGHIENVS